MPSCNPPSAPSGSWLIQVPLSELVALQELPAQMEGLKKENQQLRRELDGLRRIQSETIQALGDLRRSLKKGQP